MDEDDIRILLTRIDERVERLGADVAQLKHVVCDGNGTPSLVVQVATQGTRLEALEAGERDRLVPRHVWIGIAVSILLGLGSIAGAAAWH